MKKYYFSLIIFAVFLNTKTYCIRFNHLTTDEGLSQISVKPLYEDERGFIWAGTRDGLNLYNGNNVQFFKHEKNSSNTIISNRVDKIVGNKNGKIFLKCAMDVVEYDFRTEKFTTLLLGDVSTIYYNRHLFVARNNRILIKEDEKVGFKPYFSLPNKQAKVSCIFISENSLWIGTSNMGLFRLKNKVLSLFLPNTNISNIYQDTKGLMWICSDGNGLFQIDGKTIFNYRNTPKNPQSLSSDIVRDCCEDRLGNIWISTFNGLNKFERRKGTFINYKANSNPDGLTHSSIFSVIKDHQGSIWLGTFFGGINYFNPEYEIYTFYKPSEVESQGLSFPVVGKMIEDKYNNLWIATEGGGLNMYNPRKGTFKWYKHDIGNNTIKGNNVKALYYDSQAEIMWIGLHLGGLDRLDIKTNKFTHYPAIINNPNTLPNSIVRDIVPYKNQLIIATENGVCMFNPMTGQCQLLFKNTKGGQVIRVVSDLVFDHNGLLWLTVEGEGAFSYNFETQKLKNYKHNQAVESSISYNDINSIFEDSKHNLWFCTSGSGLELYRPATDDFEHFDNQNSNLKSNCIFQVCESSPGVLLVITNQDFARFDYAKKRFYNFNKKNGFPLSAVITSSLYKSRSGSIYLGGIHGLVSFKEKDLFKQMKSYSIYPSRLLVNDREVKVNDETGILEKALYATSKIVLPSKYNVFSVEFATSNNIAANRSEIVYKLEGFSDTWNNSRDQHTITYTNLSSGKYTLVIKADESKGMICPESRLQIEILPPFYRSTLAYLFYIILIGFIINYFLRANNSKIKLEASLKYEQKHIQDVEMLNQAKLRFFTNISHEFRTPLTLIIGKTEMLLQNQSFTPNVYNLILGVYKNGLQLRELITELLDFRKQEQGHMKISVKEHNIVDFLYENFLLFEEYANARKVNFIFNKEIESLTVWYDSKQLQKVINNLLSNAFKHTKEGNSITISVNEVDNNAVFEVTDNGSGILPEAINNIFDRFYQAEQENSVSNSGTGIGLALAKGIVDLHHGNINVISEPNIGTTFTVQLKLGNKHFDGDELTTGQEPNTQPLEISKIANDLHFEQKKIEGIGKNKSTKMLIVEDNDSLREMLVTIFENLYEVVTANDGEEGWQKVKAEAPNIVLSDVLMPKMSGTELCKLIKNDIETCHIPVLLLTARTALEHNLEGLRIGADDYITKPFNTSILVSRCNNLVNSRIILLEKFSRQPQVSPQMLATNNLDKALLDKILVIIDKYINDTDFNINTFAIEMGMSRTNLFAKIKGLTGQTPNDFVTNIRLKKAAVMILNHPEMNITEISEQLGFNSSRYFSKCFKSQYHVSPLSYRKGLTYDEAEEQEDNTIE
jgi:signal transduction histidine kinase/ligand-binding sensor domain-containing protein/DNA-binding NarL/FixJ family response regulator